MNSFQLLKQFSVGLELLLLVERSYSYLIHVSIEQNY